MNLMKIIKCDLPEGEDAVDKFLKQIHHSYMTLEGIYNTSVPTLLFVLLVTVLGVGILCYSLSKLISTCFFNLNFSSIEEIFVCILCLFIVGLHIFWLQVIYYNLQEVARKNELLVRLFYYFERRGLTMKESKQELKKYFKKNWTEGR